MCVGCSLICVNKLQLEDTEPRNSAAISSGHTHRIIRGRNRIHQIKVMRMLYIVVGVVNAEEMHFGAGRETNSITIP